MIEGTSPSRCRDGLSWLGLSLVVAPLIARATAAHSPLPWWDLDPLTEPASFIGTGPGGSLLIDGLVVLGAGVLLLASPVRPTRTWLLLACLVIVGTLGVVLHALVFPTASLGNQRIGMAWASGMIAAVSLSHAARDSRLRVAGLGAIIGLIGLLAAKSAVQVFVEREDTLEHFNRIKDSMFSADDPSAILAYQRRLGQAEGTAWFGLSNVLATFGALSTAGFGAMCLSWWGACRAGNQDGLARPRLATRSFAVCLVGAGAGLFALILADSKGGYGALVVGLGCAAIAGWAVRCPADSRPSWLPRTAVRFLPLLASAAALGAVFLRGLVGERIGELSLLFRSFYADAATRIALTHPITGVGPDGFKAAYVIAKNPLSPEEVSSPHSIFFDWWACLGAFGVAWSIASVLWLLGIGKSVAVAAALSEDKPAFSLRAPLRGALLMLAAGVLASTWLEREAATPDQALARAGGLVLACILAGGFIAAGSIRAWTLAAFAIVVTWFTHAQIEMSGIWPTSCGLLLVLMGIAAAPVVSTAPPARISLARVAGPSVITLAVLLIVVVAMPAMRWESAMAEGAARVAPLAEVNSLLTSSRAARDPNEAGKLAREAARLAGEALHQPAPTDQASMVRAVLLMQTQLIPPAIDSLEAASRAATDFATVREATRLVLRLAMAQHALADPGAVGSFTRAVAMARAAPEARSAQGQSWLATLNESWHKVTGSPGALAEAIAALRTAKPIDPFNLYNAQRLMNLLDLAGDKPATIAAAKEVLRLDDLQRLDKAVRGLPAEQRRRAEWLAAQAAPHP